MKRLFQNLLSKVLFFPKKNKPTTKFFRPAIFSLEDRIVPASVVLGADGLVQFQMANGDNLTNLFSTVTGSNLSINITGSKVTGSLPASITQIGDVLNIDVSSIINFSGLSFLGDSTGSNIIVNQGNGSVGIDLAPLSFGAADQNVFFDLSQSISSNLTIQTQVTPKGNGDAKFNSPFTFLPNGLSFSGGANTTLFLGGKIVADNNISFSSDISKVELTGPLTLDLRGSSAFEIPSTVNPTSSDYPIRLIGTGKLSLTGDSSSINNFITIENGVLDVSTPGVLSANSTINIIGGTLTGNGKVGKVTATGGVLDVTASTAINQFTAESVTLSGNSVLKVEVNSDPLQNFKILQSKGAVSISGNSLLEVSNFISSETNLNALIGNSYNVIKSNTSISGKFANSNQHTSVVLQNGTNQGTNLDFQIQPGNPNQPTQITLVFVSPPSQPATFVNPPRITEIQDSSVFGAGPGGGPEVVVYRQNIQYRFFAYDSEFTGGVKVAMADLIGNDGVPEVVTVPGPGGSPHVKIFSLVNNAFVEVQSFFAFESTFTGGSFIALGDISGISSKDIVISAGPGGGPRIQVFKFENNAYNSNPIMDFFAYSSAFSGGVVVSTGNRFGGNTSPDEIVTAPASNGGWNIRSFSYAPGSSNGNANQVEDFFVGNDTKSVGGLSIAVAKFDGILDQICVAINLPASDDPSISSRILGILGSNNSFAEISTSSLFTFPGLPQTISIGVGKGNSLIVNSGPGYAPYSGFYTYNSTNNKFFLSEIGLVYSAGFKGGLFSASSLV